MKRFLILLPALLLLVPAGAASAAPAPSVEPDRASAKPGQTVTVRLSGWPAGNVVVELCGNEAQRGSSDCAVESSATTFVAAEKTASVLLNVVKPPVGCPCVVAVRPVTGGTPRTAAIKLSGVPTLTASERRTADTTGTRELIATRVAVSGGGPAEAWFGGSADRTLSVTLRNQGAVTLTDPPLALAVGRGDDPTGVVAAPALGTLAPGQERTYRIPVTLGAPAFGRYTIRGEITGLGQPIAFTGSASSYPWALPILGALAVLLSLLAGLRRGPSRVPAAVAAATATTGVITMNQVVAANLAHWRRSQNLTTDAVAASLTTLTGRPWTSGQLAEAETAWPHRETQSFDANDLLALGRVLNVPLPALLLPPADRPYRVVAALPDDLDHTTAQDATNPLERAP